MAQILRGNFEPRNSPNVELPSTDDLTSRFEAEALRRLGGSIAFVSKKKFTLGLEAHRREAEAPNASNGAKRAGTPS
jgi:hypothetical protein